MSRFDKLLMKLRRARMSSKYEIIIYWSMVDDAFIAEVPELPGCMTHGASREESS